MQRPFIARQGDVLLIQVPELPIDARILPNQRPGFVILAEGEQTGHCHYVAELEAVMLEANEAMHQVARSAGITDTRSIIGGLQVRQATTLWHGTPTTDSAGPRDADHLPVALPAGNYLAIAPREYTDDSAEFRRVAD